MKTKALLLILVLFVDATSSSADIIVNISSGNIVAGGTGSFDVTVTGASDDVKGYDFEFLLTPLSGATTTLRFVSPQSEAFATDSDYLFFGDSDAVVSSSTITTVSTTNLPMDTLNGVDVTDSGGTVVVGATAKLLATLDVLHFLPGATDPGTTVGQTFSVTLADATFLDASNMEILYTSTPGTITIASAAVPEPSSLALVVCSGLFLCWHRRRRVSAL